MLLRYRENMEVTLSIVTLSYSTSKLLFEGLHSLIQGGQKWPSLLILASNYSSLFEDLIGIAKKKHNLKTRSNESLFSEDVL